MSRQPEPFPAQSDDTSIPRAAGRGDADGALATLLGDRKACWRCAPAERLALLIDGEAYFSALRSALVAARRRVILVGWDVHSQTDLLPGGADDGLPTRLGPLLQALLRRRRSLRIHVLTWDFAMIYALEREWVPVFRPRWFRHRRLRFVMDDCHPLAASQHQKIVTVDDTIAFCGGFDVSKWRWDSRAHRADEPHRVDSEGAPYPPFHDIQALVDGAAAQALANLARERWRRATGERLAPLSGDGHDPWPRGVDARFRQLDVAIARTLPEYNGQEEVREIEALLLHTIAGAREALYIENQYLTSARITAALEARLAAAEGPEILIVLPRATGAWLEKRTMDVLRARLLQRLRNADAHGRLRVVYPHLPGLADGECLSVHAKLMIADDRLLTVGSANLSNRSMGLDSECNLAVLACNEATRRAIRSVRDDLLGEHLGVGADAVAAHHAQGDGLFATVDALNRPDADDRRGLRHLDGAVDPALERQVPDATLLDPERPWEPARLVDALYEAPATRPLGRRLAAGLLLLGVLVAAVVLWRGEPAFLDGDPALYAAMAADLASQPLGRLGVVLLFALGCLLLVPFSALAVAVALLYPPGEAFLVALAGALLAALIAYGAGARFGRRAVRRWAGARLNRASRRVAERGILAVATLRLLPVAPYTVVNLVAGASHVRARDFLVGSALGLSPALFGICFFVDGMREVALAPDAFPVGGLLAALVALAGAVLAAVLLRRRRGSRG